MKPIYAVFVSLFGCSLLSSAATISLSTHLQGFQFATPHGHPLTPMNARIQLGNWNGSVFTEFAPSDVSPPTFSTIPAFSGRWTGDAVDNSDTAAQLVGLAIWFRITVFYQGGLEASAFFSGTGMVFPSNDEGVDNLLTVDSRNLDVVDGNASSFGARVIADPDGAGPLVGRVVVGALEDIPLVPEPIRVRLSRNTLMDSELNQKKVRI